MMERKISVKITAEDAGKNVIDFLSQRFTYRDRPGWQKEIETGRFFLNHGLCITDQTLLAAGDLLVYKLPDMDEPAVPRSVAVLYEDMDLLVVDKPAGLPCHPGGRYFNHTLWAWLKTECGLASPSLINRLDRETSGIVLVARNKKAARFCYKEFADHRVYKQYILLVEGAFPDGEIRAEGFPAKDPMSAIRKKYRFSPLHENQTLPEKAVKHCSTRFRRLRSENGLSLVKAVPQTGRCHQIRATVHSLGYPVVGDKIYGVDEQLFLRFMQDALSDADRRRLRLNRQALHAATLRMRHPNGRQMLECSSPLPAEFHELLA